MYEYEEITRTFEKALNNLRDGSNRECDRGTESLEDMSSNEDVHAGFLCAAEETLHETMGVLQMARGGALGLGRLFKFVSCGELSLVGRRTYLAHRT